MAGRLRGQEQRIQILVDGQVMTGSMTRITDFTQNVFSDITDESFVGETVDLPDLQHHGYGATWSVSVEDDSLINLLENIVTREELHLPHPTITVNIIETYRDGQSATLTSYYDAVIQQGDQNNGGRKDFLSVSYTMKAPRRNVVRL